MKNYKEFEKTVIGSSDIASLTLRYFDKVDGEVKAEFLHFGKDNEYSAYIIDSQTEIGEHYSLASDLANASWIDIFDDTQKTLQIRCGAKFYRAGEQGLIIQLNCAKIIKQAISNEKIDYIRVMGE